MPSSSATCSTSDREHHRLQVGAGLAAVLDRPAEQHQPGRRRAGAADQRRQRDVAAVPVVGDPRACPRRRTPPARAGPTSARSIAVTTSSTSSSNRSRDVGSSGTPGCFGQDRRAAHPAAPAVAAPGACRPGRHAASLSGGGARAPVRSRCEYGRDVQRPSLLALRVRSPRDRDAHLRLRRPDRRARPAGDVRRAARLRPVQRAQRAAVRPARLGGPPAGDRPVAARARPTTTCWPWPTPSARPPGRSRRAAPPADESGSRETIRRGHLRIARRTDGPRPAADPCAA